MADLSGLENVVSCMTLEEKVSLLAGKSYWRIPSIPRLGIKALKLSDGPNGVRGESIHAPTKAHCFPCGACVGAAFNEDITFQMGKALAQECRMKNAGVLLGPTLNLHRSPLGGRNFESYSEDPTLSGSLAAAYVNGVQSENVAATPKHFLGNECEKLRKISNSMIDERTMRELYAYAFQLVFKRSSPWVLMASYNKVNGISMSENAELLQGLVRKEWGFKGVIMSDWEGTYSNTSVNAGLNIEMPGPTVHRGLKLIRAVESNEIALSKIDKMVSEVIKLAAKVGMEDEDRPEEHIDQPETSQLVCQIASEGIVLLKNENNLLPLSTQSQPKIAVFGSPAKTPIIHGGGSASLAASYVVTPLQALFERFGSSNVTYHSGVPIFRKIPSAPLSSMKTQSTLQPGVDCYWYNGPKIGENLVKHEILETTRTLVIEPRIKELEKEHCIRMTFILTPETTGKHVFGVTSNGKTVIQVNGTTILSHPGFSDTKVEYIMQPGQFEVRYEISMEANKPYSVIIDSLSTTAPSPPLPAYQVPPQATQVGFYENLNTLSMDHISKLAGESDVAVVITGNNKEYESESFDRDSLALSPPQDTLIYTVAAAAPHTIVINQTGGPISMPWRDSVDAILQCWFAGQEVGNALCGILTGDVNPSGKLPVTFPVRIEDTPSFGNFPTGDDGCVRYVEGLEMGYRRRGGPAPLFPFGFGLSYTTFEVQSLDVRGDSTCDVKVEVKLANVGPKSGKEVVQVYVDGILRAFSKPLLQAGESQTVELALDKYAFSEWDVARSAWIVRPREYTIEVRRDAETVSKFSKYVIAKEYVWKGL